MVDRASPGTPTSGSDAPHPAAPPEYARVWTLRRERPAGCRDRAAIHYVAGHCDEMALALRREGGGDLVMLVRRDEPEFMWHVGVHRDGIVTDVDGHFPVADWRSAWSEKHRVDLAVARATPELVEELMNVMSLEPGRYVTSEAGVVAAVPLARALVEARDVDPRAWTIDPSRRIADDHELPRSAAEEWAAALSRARSEPADPALGTIHEAPFRIDRRWMPTEPRSADAEKRDRPAPPIGIVGQAAALATPSAPLRPNGPAEGTTATRIRVGAER